jgi:methylmalonyl-CoA mutase
MADASRLSADFPPATAEAWRTLVAKTLGEKPFSVLEKTTVEGVTIAPLYPPCDMPGEQGFPTRPFNAASPWDIRVLAAHPDPARANAEILGDLEGGAASAVVRIDPTGETGVAVGSADELARVLSGVVLELAPAGLDAGFLGPKAADWLGSVAKASPGAKLNFHMDPLSAFAESGASPGPIESHLVSAATVGVRLAETYPHGELFLASGRVVHEAGGGEAAELAFAAASAIAYAKALVRAGLPMAEAFARITLGLAADADYFLTIAKLRAAREICARLAVACGAEPTARIEARTSRRMLARQDAWTNMIRLTAAGFGAAVGGADAVVLGNFTDALGLPTAFARRQSRNSQLVLMEEAHVGRVADPAAGSGYVESTTDQLARAAWAKLQEIEAAGGIVAALTSGLIARDVEAANAARPEPKLVGVNAFPPAKEEPIEIERPDLQEIGARFVQTPAVALPGPDSACPGLKPIRLAEAYEAAPKEVSQ